MAESLADIHGLEPGPLVLADVALDQWFLTTDGRILLNDFDNSVFVGWSISQQKYSRRYLTNYVGGFKAPEGVIEGRLDDSDVWIVGDLLF